MYEQDPGCDINNRIKFWYIEASTETIVGISNDSIYGRYNLIEFSPSL